MSAYIEVGYIIKSFGTRGDLKSDLSEHYVDDIKKAKALFVQLAGNYVPFFLESISYDQFYRIKFEDVNSKEEGSKFSSKTLFLRERDVSHIPMHEKEFDLSSFVIINAATMEKIGIIEELVEMPEQLLAQIQYDSKTILIPLHEDLIQEMNMEKKEILMNLPDGILDL